MYVNKYQLTMYLTNNNLKSLQYLSERIFVYTTKLNRTLSCIPSHLRIYKAINDMKDKYNSSAPLIESLVMFIEINPEYVINWQDYPELCMCACVNNYYANKSSCLKLFPVSLTSVLSKCDGFVFKFYMKQIQESLTQESMVAFISKNIKHIIYQVGLYYPQYLPLLNKEDVVDAYEQLVSKDVSLFDLVPNEYISYDMCKFVLKSRPDFYNKIPQEFYFLDHLDHLKLLIVNHVGIEYMMRNYKFNNYFELIRTNPCYIKIIPEDVLTEEMYTLAVCIDNTLILEVPEKFVVDVAFKVIIENSETCAIIQRMQIDWDSVYVTVSKKDRSQLLLLFSGHPVFAVFKPDFKIISMLIDIIDDAKKIKMFNYICLNTNLFKNHKFCLFAISKHISAMCYVNAVDDDFISASVSCKPTMHVKPLKNKLTFNRLRFTYTPELFEEVVSKNYNLIHYVTKEFCTYEMYVSAVYESLINPTHVYPTLSAAPANIRNEILRDAIKKRIKSGDTACIANLLKSNDIDIQMTTVSILITSDLNTFLNELVIQFPDVLYIDSHGNCVNYYLLYDLTTDSHNALACKNIQVLEHVNRNFDPSTIVLIYQQLSSSTNSYMVRHFPLRLYKQHSSIDYGIALRMITFDTP